MKILVTGAKGFVGKNLCAQLKNIRDGQVRNYGVSIDEVFEYDIDSMPAVLSPLDNGIILRAWRVARCY